MTLLRTIAASLLVFSSFAAAEPVRAQDYERPPVGYGDDAPDYPGGGGRAPVDAPDPASLAVRVSKLEGRIREMTGQIEELQNDNRRLIEQLQKFQGDVDSRLTSGGRQKRSGIEPAPVAGGSLGESGAGAVAETATPPKSRIVRRDDAFDPDAAAAAGSPGTPKPLGSPASAQSDDGSAPMDLAGGKMRQSDAGSADTIAPTLRLPSATPKADGSGRAPTTPNGTVIASTGPTAAAPATPRAAYEVALGYYKDKQYETAEKSFTEFLQKNPKNRYAADATFYLGESYAKRGRSREAAEQYLKISTDFAGAPRAPEAMLHLGMSLKALGAKEQACATFSEVARKYPNAPDYVKTGAERETKRAQC